MTISILLLCFAAAKSDMHRVLPEGMHIVEGVVLDAKASGRSYPSTIRINRAYGPEEDLVGRQFTARSADPQVKGNRAYLVIPRLRVGERGIWVVQDVNGDLRYVDLYNFIRWPVRQVAGRGYSPPAEVAKRFAEAVERVSKLPSADDATAALERLTTDANPYISSWAITRLPATCPDAAGATRFLQRLVGNEHIPIQGQVALDRALLGQKDGSILVEHHNREWQYSEARLKLFQRWCNGALSARDAQLVITRLDITAQHPGEKGFRQEELMQLVTLLLNNDKFSLAERQRASTIIMWAASRYETDVGIFKAAVALVSSDLPEQLRAAIAAEFIRGFTLDDTRRKSLQKLRDEETAKSVIAFLDEALARPNGKPKRDFVPPGAASYSKRGEAFSPPKANEPAK